MGCEAVAQGMRVNALFQAGADGCFANRAPYRFVAHGAIGVFAGLTGEEIGLRFGIRRAPIITEFSEKPGTEHDPAVFLAFALTDVNEHPRTVDVLDLQP